jgi:hypothetical protein
LTITPGFFEAEAFWCTFQDGTPLRVLLKHASTAAVEHVRTSLFREAEHTFSPLTRRLELLNEALLAGGIKEQRG